MRFVVLLIATLILVSGCVWKEFFLTEFSYEPTAFVNYALAENGATVTASGENPDHPASTLINGIKDSNLWDEGEGWELDYEISYEFFAEREMGLTEPATISLGWVSVEFPEPRKINRMLIHTLNSKKYPANSYGVRKLIIQYKPVGQEMEGAGWFGIERTDRALGQPLNGVKNNRSGVMDIRFKPVVTQNVRITVQATNDMRRDRRAWFVGTIRLIEIEIFGEERKPTAEEDLF